jgi:hypothetical protein
VDGNNIDNAYFNYSNAHDAHDAWWTKTIEDVTYRPGMWVNYVNNVLLPKAKQEEERGKNYNTAKIDTERHKPFYDADIFG